MKKERLAKSAKEFDRRFDAGKDVHDLLDMEKAKVARPGKKIRLTIDVAETLVNELDGGVKITNASSARNKT